MTELVCIRPNGERIAITLAIGHPFATPEGDWQCPVTINGLHENLTNIHGSDSLQSICLAIAFVHTRLASFVADGGRIIFPATGEDFPMDAYFGLVQANR